MNKIFIIAMLCLVSLFTIETASAKEETINNDIRFQNVRITPVGDNMMIEMEIVLDDLKIKSNRSMVFTPMIESWDGDLSQMAQPIMITGRKQHIYYLRNNSKSNYPNAIEYRRNKNKPQTVQYTSMVPYQSWMDSYRLNLIEDLCGCGRVIDNGSEELMEHMPLPTTAFFAYVVPEMEAVKARSIEGKAYLDFPVNQTVIYPDYRRNPEELSIILQTINTVKEDKNISITGINIHGYASPEGSYANNERLAKGRAEALKEYVRRLYNFPNDIFTVESTPEDWVGLRNWIIENKVANAEQLVAIIDSDKQPDAKEQEIKRTYPAIYSQLLQECYPGLRHSDYVVNYVIRPFTIDEAKEIILVNPSQLSLYEVYQIANSYEKGSPEQIQTLITAAALFPENAEANLNAANALVEAGDINTATHFLDRSGDLPQAQMLRGIILMKQGEINTARSLFLEAEKAGIPEATDNLKLIENFKY